MKREPRLPWTAKEDEFLVAEYTDGVTADIAHRLGRSCASIRQRANRLGLHRDDKVYAQLRVELKPPADTTRIVPTAIANRTDLEKAWS